MTFPQRAIGAARLEIPVFEEIEADRDATGQALLVVVLSNLAAGIGVASYYSGPVLHGVLLALLLPDMLTLIPLSAAILPDRLRSGSQRKRSLSF